MLTFLLLLYVGLGFLHAVAFNNVAIRYTGERFINVSVRIHTLAFFEGINSYIGYLKELSKNYVGCIGDIQFNWDKSTWILYRLNYVFLPLSIVLAIAFAPIAYLAKATYKLKRKIRLAKLA